MTRQHDDTTDHVKEAQERISAEVDKLMATERWQRYLRLQARFHHYSFGNVMLIMSQCDDPTYLKGFKGWLDLGRAVRKGEKAIRILAPRGRGVRTEQNEDGEDQIVASWQRFGTVAIFDISQTQAIPDHPRPFDPDQMQPWSGALESGDSQLAFDLMMAAKVWAQDQGATVTMGGENHPKAAGYFDPRTQEIWVRERPYPAMASTMIHEVAHMLTHQALGLGESSSVHEIVAESVAFVVCDYFGIESTLPSAEYLAVWMSRDIKAARKTLPHIQKCAAQIIDALVGALEGPYQDLAEAA